MPLSKEQKQIIEHQFYDVERPGNLAAAKKLKTDPAKYIRGISAGAYTIGTTGPALDEAIAYWNDLAEKEIQLHTKQLDALTQIRRERSRLAQRRLLDVPAVNHRALYRKMSLGEWRSLFSEWGEDAPSRGRYANNSDGKTILFQRPFEYTDTDNYRLWFSTSLMKCRSFDNANATQSTDVIMRFWFDISPKDSFMRTAMLPHKQPGVQRNPDVVAWHREGFAEEQPSISDTEVMKERLRLPVTGGSEVKRHYNLGFTSQQQEWLKDHCVAAEPMFNG